MFEIHDMVMYGREGVCEITGIEKRDFFGEIKSYFVLKPIKNNSAVCYVPTDNPSLLAKMRRILTTEEIHELIDSMPAEQVNWIDNEAARADQYARILSNGNHAELIRMIKAIFLEKKTREADKKRLRASDERFLKDAEQLLHGEFQYVLNLNEDEVVPYIFSRIERG